MRFDALPRTWGLGFAKGCEKSGSQGLGLDGRAQQETYMDGTRCEAKTLRGSKSSQKGFLKLSWPPSSPCPGPLLWLTL